MIKSEVQTKRSEREHDESYSFIRDPFAERPREVKSLMMRQTKRTQRYRSTAKSRICGMTVGDIRYCFQQLRSAGNALSPQLVLYNGQCAGEFALSYLIETSNSMRKKRKKKRLQESGSQDAIAQISSPTLPKSQLPTKKKHQNPAEEEEGRYLLEF